MKRITVAVPFIKGNQDNYFNALRAVGLEPVQLRSADGGADCDGLLIPGGADIDPELYGEKLAGSVGISAELDRLQLAVLAEYCAAGKPVLGICRGHQLINVFFGGTLHQHLDTADAHRRLGVDEQFHPVNFIGNSFLTNRYSSGVIVNSTHHQGVKNPGRGLRVIAKAPDGTVEGLMHETLPVLSVQWHPERMLDAPSGRAEGRYIFNAFKEMMESSKN